MQGVLYGKPDLTPEEEQLLKLQAEQTAQDMQMMESMSKQQAAPQMGQQVPQQQQSASPTGQAQPQPKQGGGLDIGGLARQTLEGAVAVPTALLDFGADRKSTRLNSSH